MPAIVRVPGHAPEPIAAALDGGAPGILVPRVSTAAQAAAAVKAIALPAGPASAASAQAARPATATASSTIWPSPMPRLWRPCRSETAEGLANADAIAATEGIDLVFVGPGDLSVSIGALGADGAARLGEAIETMIAAASRRRQAAGIFCATPEDVGRWLGSGISLFILSSDAMFLGAAASVGVQGRPRRP